MPLPDATERSGVLTDAIARAMRVAGLPEDETAEEPGGAEPGGELVAELLGREIRLAAGQRGELGVALKNRAASEIRGEAQLISPHETWAAIDPWTQGFAIGPGQDARLSFAVEPPFDFAGGSYWALVKIMYFGRLLYTEPVTVVLDPAVTPSSVVTEAHRSASRA